MAGQRIKKKSFIRRTASALVKFRQELSVRTIYSIICLFRFVLPAKKNYWAFPVHFKQGSFSDNMRPVFEEVKNDATIRKIIFTTDVSPEIENAENTIIVNLLSFKGLWLLVQCKVIFVQHSLLRDFRLQSYLYRQLLLRRAFIVNLWHGIAIKYIQYLDNTSVGLDENRYYDLVISSSKTDRMVMASAFYPITVDKVAVTGLPRNDYLIKEKGELPQSYNRQLDALDKIKGAKKLIVYAPTYREIKKGGDYYLFSTDEIAQLRAMLKQNNTVLGFRAHYYKNSKVNYELLVDNEVFFNLGQETFSDMNMIIRNADLIITDYSSLFVDALYINKPVINFVYDLEHYSKTQRGLFYDFENVAPGKICTTFEMLVPSIKNFLDSKSIIDTEKYDFLKKLFFDAIDGENAERVVRFVKSKIEN